MERLKYQFNGTNCSGKIFGGTEIDVDQIENHLTSGARASIGPFPVGLRYISPKGRFGLVELPPHLTRLRLAMRPPGLSSLFAPIRDKIHKRTETSTSYKYGNKVPVIELETHQPWTVLLVNLRLGLGSNIGTCAFLVTSQQLSSPSQRLGFSQLPNLDWSSGESCWGAVNPPPISDFNDGVTFYNNFISTTFNCDYYVKGLWKFLGWCLENKRDIVEDLFDTEPLIDEDRPTSDRYWVQHLNLKAPYPKTYMELFDWLGPNIHKMLMEYMLFSNDAVGRVVFHYLWSQLSVGEVLDWTETQVCENKAGLPALWRDLKSIYNLRRNGYRNAMPFGETKIKNSTVLTLGSLMEVLDALELNHVVSPIAQAVPPEGHKPHLYGSLMRASSRKKA